jgi:RES domain-containing protein
VVTDGDGNEVDEAPVGYGAARMKPRVDRAVEGRANPAGIPVLYLGATIQTAISEVRPWIGASVSVAQFKVLRKLRALDLSLGHGKRSFCEIDLEHFLNKEPVDAQKKGLLAV